MRMLHCSFSYETADICLRAFTETTRAASGHFCNLLATQSSVTVNRIRGRGIDPLASLPVPPRFTTEAIHITIAFSAVRTEDVENVFRRIPLEQSVWYSVWILNRGEDSSIQMAWTSPWSFCFTVKIASTRWHSAGMVNTIPAEYQTRDILSSQGSQLRREGRAA